MAEVKAVGNKQKFREIFLKNFVRELINQSYVEAEEKRVEEKEVKPEAKAVGEIGGKMQRSLMVPVGKRALMKKAFPLPTIRGAPMQPPPLQQIPIAKGKMMEAINLGKVAQILRDPSVFSVECPGPGRNLLVNRAGTIQTSPTILSKQEIDTLMDEISNRIRIPLIPRGLFKAAFQDLLITAVISEFVGSRFIIRKRMPFEGQPRVPGQNLSLRK